MSKQFTIVISKTSLCKVLSSRVFRIYLNSLLRRNMSITILWWPFYKNLCTLMSNHSTFICRQIYTPVRKNLSLSFICWQEIQILCLLMSNRNRPVNPNLCRWLQQQMCGRMRITNICLWLNIKMQQQMSWSLF